MSLKVFFTNQESTKIREYFGSVKGVYDIAQISKGIREVVLATLKIEIHEHRWEYDKKSRLHSCMCGVTKEVTVQ